MLFEILRFILFILKIIYSKDLLVVTIYVHFKKLNYILDNSSSSHSQHKKNVLVLCLKFSLIEMCITTPSYLGEDDDLITSE